MWSGGCESSPFFGKCLGLSGLEAVTVIYRNVVSKKGPVRAAVSAKAVCRVEKGDVICLLHENG